MRANPFDMRSDAVPEIPAGLRDPHAAVHCCRGSVRDPGSTADLFRQYPYRLFHGRYWITTESCLQDFPEILQEKSQGKYPDSFTERLRVLFPVFYTYYITGFSRTFSRTFLGNFPTSGKQFPDGKVPSGLSDLSGRSWTLSGSFPDLFPWTNNKKIRRVSPPDFSNEKEKNYLELFQDYSSGFSANSFPVFSLMHTRIPCSKGDHLVSGCLVTSPPM